jgi:hypothetical protein
MNGSKTVVGIDIAKRVFQLHWIDMESGEIVSLQLKREKFLEHFANRQKCLIGMEACGGALIAFGDEFMQVLVGRRAQWLEPKVINDEHMNPAECLQLTFICIGGARGVERLRQG